MDANEIRDLAEHAAGAGIRMVEWEADGLRLVLRLAARPAAPSADRPADPADQPIVSPACGTFHARHPARAEPEIAVGEAVSRGRVVAFVVAGPLLIPVVAPAAGRIGQTLIRDGTRVGFGDPLVAFEITQPSA
ncbi:acetyl-CoA carboxylase biotin carboxyl carrier protein [Methylobacterium nodulans]|uniref:Biotin/lipoyl attachment domain-containing protein n=1 Tax=Methylobacterium nodulans (strain LMG 21967 / CNCM I-2342 / ORS 2060) TaxID=460265 RepID=B8IGM3_METNO|nr:biotin/lipoyl-containing protein [Methylobacterium nodulans]ACL55923.1 biotin/lipoyl attachment domain-containing protein [Methylobacterium nodulans ORS 2060]